MGRRAGRDGDEDHIPAFALPVEPAYLTRAERLTTALILLVVIAQLSVGLVLLLTGAQVEDPALQRGDATDQAADA